MDNRILVTTLEVSFQVLVTALTVPVLVWLIESGKSQPPLEEERGGGEEEEEEGSRQAEKEDTDDDTPMSDLLALHRSADGKSKRIDLVCLCSHPVIPLNWCVDGRSCVWRWRSRGGGWGVQSNHFSQAQEEEEGEERSR